MKTDNRKNGKGKEGATLEKRKVGRAPKSPDEEVLKNKAFNMPVTLAAEVVSYADAHFSGNASKLATEVFREFLVNEEFQEAVKTRQGK